jgi:DHA1 family multidrug/chloramphenicol efflux transport protein-like MFS transporter
VVLQWLIGPLADRYGRRPLLLTGCLFFGVACLATFWVHDIGLFNLLRLLQGIGLGFVVTVSYPALNEAFSEADAVRMMALLANIALLSPLLGPLVGTLMLQWLDWRWLFVAFAIGAVLCWLLLYRLMPETLGWSAATARACRSRRSTCCRCWPAMASCWPTAGLSRAARRWAWSVCR